MTNLTWKPQARTTRDLMSFHANAGSMSNRDKVDLSLMNRHWSIVIVLPSIITMTNDN